MEAFHGTVSTTGASPEQSRYVEDVMSGEDSAQQLAAQSNKTFQLTDKGVKVAQHVWGEQSQEAQKAFEQIKKQYGSMSLKQLLKYVYTRYPDMTENSEIKGWVHGR